MASAISMTMEQCQEADTKIENYENHTDNECEESSSDSSSGCIIQAKLENDSANNNISSSKKFTKVTGPFSVEELSYILKTSISLRIQIFPPSISTYQHNDEDEFTIKSISNGYVSHAFTFRVNEKFLNKKSRNEFFIKINKNKDAKQMFDAEAIGLHALQETCRDLIRVPQSLSTGYLSEFDHDQGAWFLSEFVAMSNTSNKRSDRQNRQFAQILAKVHQISAENHSKSSRNGQYGFDINNFSIHTEQDNTWQNDWCTFFIEQRLKPVIKRMKTDPHLIDNHIKNMELILLCERLIPHIPWFLSSNQLQIRPSLLHGDLSNQNWSIDKKGHIVIFDGSPFYCPYELDIYIMPKVFIEAYFDAIGGPIDGYEIRFELYNLLRLVRSVIDSNLDIWRPLVFQSLNKLLAYCGAWTSSLVRFPCGVKTPVNKIKLPSLISNITKKKNAILIYGGTFCTIHLNHLEVMDFISEKRVSIQYPLVVVDRSGYNGEILWNEHFQKTTVKNRERLIWISPWKGIIRSSTMIRNLLTKSDYENIRENLQNFLPLSCIDYILEYNLKNWFKSSELI